VPKNYKDNILSKGGSIMPSLSKIIKLLALTLLVSACATAIPQIPEKYELDNQLDRINVIQDFRFTGRPSFTDFTQSFEDAISVMNRRDTALLNKTSHHWTEVDHQSLIIRTGPSEYYLLVLDRPAPEIMFSEDISIYSMNNVLKAGADYVEFPRYNNNIRYTIERIYKINGLEQMHAIRHQLMDK
jgi:hypothetical protein